MKDEAKINDVPVYKRRKATSGDPKLQMLVTQIVICMIILLFALIIKFIGGDLYKQAKQSYIYAFEDKTSISQVVETMTRAFDTVGKPPKTEKNASNISDTDTESWEEDNNQSNDDEGLFVEADEQDKSTYIFDFTKVEQMSQIKSAKNAMALPVSDGRITSEFGYRVNPISSEWKLHGGIDIGADVGDSIKAALPGVVKVSERSSSYGLYIVIDHGDGLQTLYAHCSKLIAKVGDKVEKGELIAKVGSTGDSNGPHLHFEVRINGTRLNPQPLLPKIRKA